MLNDQRNLIPIIPGTVELYPGLATQANAHSERSQYNIYICACSDGSAEYRTAGEYYYMSMGDILFSDCPPVNCFSADDHKGFILAANDRKLSERLPLGINSNDIDLTQAKHMLEQHRSFIIRSTDKLRELIQEMSEVTFPVTAISKLRTIEFLLYISHCDLEKLASTNQYCSRSQLELARAVEALLVEDPGRHLTIDQLANDFKVSPTKLKSVFRSVYGDSVYAYTKKKKMKTAAALLEKNELSVQEIAHKCGYENCSKFSKAFRSVYGISPREYRMKKL